MWGVLVVDLFQPAKRVNCTGNNPACVALTNKAFTASYIIQRILIIIVSSIAHRSPPTSLKFSRVLRLNSQSIEAVGQNQITRISFQPIAEGKLFE